MRALRAALVLLAAATLQVAFSGTVAIRGASPDLLLLFAVYVALYDRRPKTAFVTGVQGYDHPLLYPAL